ncbi:MAG: T9SS type A sorting domain-containing protein [Bacteroidota bacterium]
MSRFFIILIPVCFTYIASAQNYRDCVTAVDVSDSTSLIFYQLEPGFGQDSTELIFPHCINSYTDRLVKDNERNTVWLTWTARSNDLLTFIITPEDEADDLDFILFQVDGEDKCADKFIVRCMASGDFQFPSPCMGPTGLRIGETETETPAGCRLEGQSNFLAPLEMMEGTQYVLMVNNFTSSTRGFQIDFCGTAAVPVANQEGCPISSTSSVITNHDLSFSLHPNPALSDEIINIQADIPLSIGAVIQVFDVAGRQISDVKIDMFSRDGWQLHTHSLSSGLYIVHLADRKHFSAKRLLITR